MKKAGKYQETVETFESLSEKLAGIQKEMSNFEEQLLKSQYAISSAEDSLDDYMKHIDIIMDTSTIRQIKQRIGILRKEEQQLKRLVEIARPSSITDVTSDTYETDPIMKQKDRERPSKPVNYIHEEKTSSLSGDGLTLPRVSVALPSGTVKDSASKEPNGSSAATSDDIIPRQNRAQEVVGDTPRLYGPMRPDHIIAEDIVNEDDIENDTITDEEKADAKRKKRREKRQRCKERRQSSHKSDTQQVDSFSFLFKGH